MNISHQSVGTKRGLRSIGLFLSIFDVSARPAIRFPTCPKVQNPTWVWKPHANASRIYSSHRLILGVSRKDLQWSTSATWPVISSVTATSIRCVSQLQPVGWRSPARQAPQCRRWYWAIFGKEFSTPIVGGFPDQSPQADSCCGEAGFSPRVQFVFARQSGLGRWTVLMLMPRCYRLSQGQSKVVKWFQNVESC